MIKRDTVEEQEGIHKNLFNHRRLYFARESIQLFLYVKL